MDEQRIVRGIERELEIAIAAVATVTRLLDEPDGPWNYVHLTLFRERAGGIRDDLQHMAVRVAETGQVSA
ncbi:MULTISPECIES: hypothetical protein [unclassified Frankia]|uniref:hypothetical protein n=1 Tax=unclassified Frankia TaxID=2632575 RepID=UPI002AD4BA09|nr:MULTISPECIES: hypothetical protein [unclassified Frankia]